MEASRGMVVVRIETPNTMLWLVSGLVATFSCFWLRNRRVMKGSGLITR